jgi:hypothetical protein
LVQQQGGGGWSPRALQPRAEVSRSRGPECRRKAWSSCARRLKRSVWLRHCPSSSRTRAWAKTHHEPPGPGKLPTAHPCHLHIAVVHWASDHIHQPLAWVPTLGLGLPHTHQPSGPEHSYFRTKRSSHLITTTSITSGILSAPSLITLPVSDPNPCLQRRGKRFHRKLGASV